MTAVGRFKCDVATCDNAEDTPPDGGYPDGWGALSFRTSQAPTKNRASDFKDKRRWYHVCPECGKELLRFMGINQKTKVETSQGA